MLDQQVVLPDTLVAQLIGDAATLSGHLKSDFERITSKRSAIRTRLVQDRQIVALDDLPAPVEEVFAIDGAHLAEIDRASAYSASCAVRVGRSQEENAQSSCLAILPHVPSLNTLSSGLMAIQEIVMAVRAAEAYPNALCLIDGSRISAIIAINQFYTSVQRDLPHQLDHWRAQASSQPDREPGRTLNEFEARDWMSVYLTHPHIIGNLKLVTTNRLVEMYAPEWLGRFDDKTFAAAVLEPGELLRPVAIPPPEEPFHINQAYPYSRAVDKLQPELTLAGNPNQVYHLYYRPDLAHGVFKIEMNRAMGVETKLLKPFLAWWNREIPSVDLLEPYALYIADRFAKQAVSVSKHALKEIARREMVGDSWAWFFTQAYRSE